MKRCVYIWIFLLLTTAAAGQAQTLDRAPETQTNAAYFFLYRPGEATVRVAVLGDVRLPGIYEVGVGLHIGDLLSLAGGPQIDAAAQRGNLRVERTVRLLRDSPDGRQVIYEAPLEQMLLETDQYPLVEENDLLSLETQVSARFGWRDTITVIAGAATLALAVERFVSLSR